jgi:hypothetical protein
LKIAQIFGSKASQKDKKDKIQALLQNDILARWIWRDTCDYFGYLYMSVLLRGLLVFQELSHRYYFIEQCAFALLRFLP